MHPTGEESFESSLGETQEPLTQTQTQPVKSRNASQKNGPSTWAILVPLTPPDAEGPLPTFECQRSRSNYTIGRAARGRFACDLVLESKKISAIHATISIEYIEDPVKGDGTPFIIDHSSNGTFVNGESTRFNAQLPS